MKHTHCPNIGHVAIIVGACLHQLWPSVGGRTTVGVQSLSGGLFDTESKVTELGLFRRGEIDIVRFNIAMHNVVSVKVEETFEDPSHKGCRPLFRDMTYRHAP
jgi:hypothetical protein